MAVLTAPAYPTDSTSLVSSADILSGVIVVTTGVLAAPALDLVGGYGADPTLGYAS